MTRDLNKALYVNGARIFIRDIRLEPPWIFDINHGSSFIKLHFLWEGSSSYIPKTADGTPVNLSSGQYNFFYLPKVDGTLSLNSTRVKSVEVEFDDEFLKKVFEGEFFKISGVFGEAVRKQVPFKMWEESPMISDQLYGMLGDVMQCVQAEKVNLSTLQAMVKQIMLHLFSVMNNEVPSTSSSILSVSELDQVSRAEKLLRAHLQKSITVEELAYSVGTNRYKLNRYFKQVYNEPVFTYLTKLRMEAAKQMLVNERKNVSQVAYEVGYKNPQHFTVAFKKHFGHLPSMFKTV